MSDSADDVTYECCADNGEIESIGGGIAQESKGAPDVNLEKHFEYKKNEAAPE
jgi:hypothetical protein